MKKMFVFAALAVRIAVVPAQDVLPGYDGFWASHRGMITVLDLAGFQPERLPFLRNEIYARYGRAFTSQAYRDYFNIQHWYRIRDNYSDAWLSENDVKNAALIRSLELAPLPTETLRRVLENIEYLGTGAVLTFSSPNRLVWTDPNVDFGPYGINGYGTRIRPWVSFGGWILVYGKTEYWNEYHVAAYQLDHDARRILATVQGAVDIAALNEWLSPEEAEAAQYDAR
jgi:hypothetical protein